MELPAYALLKSHKDAEDAKDAERRGAERRGPEAQRKRVTIDDLSYQIGAAMVAHSDLGPGLNEKTYDACFGDQLSALGLQFEHQVRFPVMSCGSPLSSTFRIDYVVRKAVIVEIKVVEIIHPVHVAQLRSYLMTGLTLGLIINFNVVHLRDGIKRIVNAYIYIPNTEV